MIKIFLSGHSGMVGTALAKRLESLPHIELIKRTRHELDLTDQKQVRQFFASEKPDYVIMAAAKVGGIEANNKMPAEFIYENIQIQSNIVSSAHLSDVQRLIFLGSSCIYPKSSKQPIAEEQLLSGKLEPTNEAYAIAKISGIKMCESYNRQYGRDYRCIMPTNLYGPADNFHYENSHVIPGLMRRIYEAKIKAGKQVVIWGSGKPKREFLHVQDLADATVFILNIEKDKYWQVVSPRCSHLNVGSGIEISISQLAGMIKEIVGYEGKLVFDSQRPDGMMRKVMDTSKMNSLGWTHSITLSDGLKKTFNWFEKNFENIRK
tara:strand:- start:859 stop:1818 length:960 start_codon:yes stop_codon:yes gene_type:complete